MSRMLFNRCPRCGNASMNSGFDASGRHYSVCEVCSAGIAEAVPHLESGRGGEDDET